MKRSFLKDDQGSALLLAIAAAGVLGVIVMAGMSISKQVTDQTKRLQPKLNTARLTSYVSTLMSDPKICAGVPGTPFTGIDFFDSGGTVATKAQFDPTRLNQKIQVGSNLTAGVLKPGLTVDDFGVKINNIYLGQVLGAGANYTANVYLSASDPTNGTTLSSEMLGTLHMGFTGGVLTSCSMKLQAQDVCDSMGCAWNAAGSPKCTCNFHNLSCNSPPAGDPPYGYVQGYTNTNGTIQKICRSADFTCPGGQFLQGFDAQGGMRCVTAVVSGTFPPATPTPLPPTVGCIPVGDYAWAGNIIAPGSSWTTPTGFDSEKSTPSCIPAAAGTCTGLINGVYGCASSNLATCAALPQKFGGTSITFTCN
jgi:hypothetical protein